MGTRRVPSLVMCSTTERSHSIAAMTIPSQALFSVLVLLFRPARALLFWMPTTIIRTAPISRTVRYRLVAEVHPAGLLAMSSTMERWHLTAQTRSSFQVRSAELVDFSKKARGLSSSQERAAIQVPQMFYQDDLQSTAQSAARCSRQSTKEQNWAARVRWGRRSSMVAP